MTGESDELKKDSIEECKKRLEEKDAEFAFYKNAQKNSHDIPSPILISGTQISTGEGVFVCIVLGKNSCVGKIMSKLVSKIETTPLQNKLEAIATDIGVIGIYVALLTIHILFLRFFIEHLMNRDLQLFDDDE